MSETNQKLMRSFFARDTVEVARDLLGKRLVHVDQGRRLAGIIVETEAYRGEEDQGCHCRAGRTERTSVMYGPPGVAYVYFVYGMHWLLNLVTEEEGYPGAVLLRALSPDEGLDVIAERRKKQPPRHWMDGPAKLTQALGVDGGQNGLDSCQPGSDLFVEPGYQVEPGQIQSSPRIGLGNVPEPWKSIPWRFTVDPAQLI